MRTSIETYSGAFFDFLDPDPATVAVEDVARALSNTCRFGGHTARFYSVAEHALLVRHLVVNEAGRPDLALPALHHDSHEAYLGDIPTPLKGVLGYFVDEMAARIDRVIADALGFDVEGLHDPVIADADERALRLEAAVLKPSRGIGGAWPYRALPEPVEAWHAPLGLSPHNAESAFLRAHHLSSRGARA